MKLDFKRLSINQAVEQIVEEEKLLWMDTSENDCRQGKWFPELLDNDGPASYELGTGGSDDKRQQILALGRLGWSLRRIEQATGVASRDSQHLSQSCRRQCATTGGWGRRAKPAIQVITDSTPAKQDNSAPETAKPAIQVTTDSGPAKESANPTKARTLSHCEPYRDLIELGVQRGRNAMAIWQDLVSEQGFAHGYNSVRRFVNKLHPSEVKQARAVIITEPGEEAQVDYGTGPWVRETQSAKYRRTRLFVMTLGFSRKAARLLVFRSSARTWAELHKKAFRRFGGIRRQSEVLADCFSFFQVYVLETVASGPSLLLRALRLLPALSLTHWSTFIEQVRMSAFNDVDKTRIGHTY